ncbi:type I-C CRISPR-associated endonuclease Cas1c [Litorilinea aerophila]|uniref:CRISPR-associated endonuclease Cas1 n=1 Tax=Litorilinea aerophila TaxID=1204385 RepID=A0A540VA45_9CHLR|nr:type I-C CRISPR-associated endonuclease Cas1c [Litorilinea aerophila]MCC9078490.1 type I-C CRISPR-associated endonuclease Cas1c [Litorilinea aerophila]OUC05084.1 CRISPR-associated protein Cas1 [Litorilinea aerophila]
MKKLGNILYVTTPEAYLSLDGENVVVKRDDTTAMRLPLHNLENIVCFNYPGVSPALMGACAERNIGLCFLRPNGRFLARVTGRQKGNLLLRKKQYELSQCESACASIATSMVLGKIANCRTVINRAIRDHALLVDVSELRATSDFLKQMLQSVQAGATVETLRGLEGNAASRYFRVFGQLVLHQREAFAFEARTRRPPQDNMNALLSFLYTLLTYEVASALETVGLDPYVGFLHADRPGRPSLALDMMEELRPVLADRLALSLVNRKQISGKGFTQKESGGVLMDDRTRKEVLVAWQKRKQEEILHPFLKERIPFGLLPHVQASLLARYVRGDLDAYPPFFWN